MNEIGGADKSVKKRKRERSKMFSISLELFLLLRWMLNYISDAVESLVDNAIASGFLDELSATTEEQFSDLVPDAPKTIVDFMTFIEDKMAREISAKIHLKNFLDDRSAKSGHGAVKAEAFSGKRRPGIESRLYKIAEEIHDKKALREDKEVKAELKRILLKWAPSSNEPVN